MARWQSKTPTVAAIVAVPFQVHLVAEVVEVAPLVDMVWAERQSLLALRVPMVWAAKL